MLNAPRSAHSTIIIALLLIFSCASLGADPFQDAQDKGVSLYNSENYKEAIPYFKQASESLDKGAVLIACLYIGSSYGFLGDHGQAIPWFERALEIEQNNLFALEGLATSCFSDRSYYEKGYRYARKAQDLYSENSTVYYNLACYYGYKADASSALKYTDMAFLYGFADLDILAADADFQAVRGKEPYKSFQANFPSVRNTFTFYSKAEEAKGKGNYLEAQRFYQQAIDSCRTALGKDSLTESGLLSYMGSAYQFLNKYPQALDAYTRALTIQKKALGGSHPYTAGRYVYLGRIHYLLSRYDDAIGDYLEALTIQIAALGETSSEAGNTYTYLGGAYSAKGEYPKAAEYYKKALLSIDASSAQGALAKVATETRLASVLLADSKFGEAAASYKNVLETQLDTLGPDHPDVARTYVALGSLNISLGDFEETENYYNEALRIQLKALGASSLETIATYEGLGDLYYVRSEFNKAEQRYLQDLDAIKKSVGESSEQAAQCYQRLGSTDYSLGRYEESAAYYEQARAIWIKILGENHPEVARCLLGSAAVRYTMGLYDNAIADYSKALSIQIKTYGENNMDVAKNYLGLGLSYYSKGEFSKAISYYEMAVPIQKKLAGDYSPDLSRSYMNLSVAYDAMRDTDNAIAYINKCTMIQNKIFGPQHLDLSVSYKIAAGIYSGMGGFSEAIAYYQKALDIQTLVLGHDHQQVAETLNNLGATYESEKSYDKAIEMYRESLAIHEKVFGKESPLLALDYLNLGSAYRKKGDAAQALDFMKSAELIARKSPDRQLATLIARNLGELYYDLKRYPDAKKALQEGIRVVEKARADIGTAKAEYMARNLDLYYFSLFASAAQNDMDEVFAAAESLKARGYLDRLSLSKALSVKGVSEKDRKRMLEISERLGKLTNVQEEEISKPEDLQDKKALLSVIGEIQALEAEYEKTDRSLMKIARYRELSRPEMVKLKDAQKTLKPDQAYIDYILYGEETGWYARCLVVKRDSVALVDLDSSFDYTKAVNDYYQSIQKKDRGRDAQSALLFKALIKPLESKLSGVKQLIIVPDDILAILPFDALRKDGNSPYLCQSYQITLAPSISVLKMIDGRPAGKRKGDWLGLGGVPYGPDSGQGEGRGLAISGAVTEKTKAYYAALGAEAYFGARGLTWRDLPGTEYEVKTIAQEAFGGKGVRLLLGDQASMSNVKKLSDSGELAEQKIVHFACHAFFDAEYPQYSSLVLSEAGAKDDGASGETGYLTVEDVALLRFNADLVALSACETGKGTQWLGDGLVGFTRSLLVAGANRAEVTLWPIDDAATKDFMLRWYTLIQAEGLDYSDALTRVKREFIKSGQYSDPAYWSGFVLYGR
jgi:tetratricopeptide (TPR) repeat protein/CHAT domain-containing protein